MRTSNPIMKEKVFSQTLPGVETMTLQGAVNKTVILLALVVIGAGYTWNLFYNQGPEVVQPWMMTGLIGGLLCSISISSSAALAEPPNTWSGSPRLG